MKANNLLLCVCLGMSVLTGRASAGTWAEVGDAGELIGTHQDPMGTGSLDTITGMLDPQNNDFVDMYCITITNPPSAFSAVTSSPFMLNFSLWLFDSNKHGVTGTQGGFLFFLPPALSSTSVPTTGTYYLAITSWEMFPYDSSGQLIWNVTRDGVEYPANGPGLANQLASWAPIGGSHPFDSYTIFLTGGSYCSQVPEPASWVLAGVCLTTLLVRRWSRGI